MRVSKSFDLSWSDLSVGLVGCLHPDGRVARDLGKLWSEQGDAIACLSVRSGFDLYCGAAAFPENSEIVFTAMTIEDMPRIARAHGLIPIPCDIDPETLLPSLDALERACTGRTRQIVVTTDRESKGALVAIGEVGR